MQTEVEKALAVLVGKRLWACRRAADMATFQFGKRSVAEDFYGKPTEVGEYALHIQCPWRIIGDQKIIVGSSDLYYPAEYNDGDPLPSDFDWERDGNRRDTLLRALFDGGRREFAVQRIEAALVGSFRMIFDSGMLLEVCPVDSLQHEYWRLLSPNTDLPHFVVTGAGIET